MRSTLHTLIAAIWTLTIIGGCTYLVFWKDASGWWYLLAMLFLPNGCENKK
jgi:hypothetical protein